LKWNFGYKASVDVYPCSVWPTFLISDLTRPSQTSLKLVTLIETGTEQTSIPRCLCLTELGGHTLEAAIASEEVIRDLADKSKLYGVNSCDIAGNQTYSARLPDYLRNTAFAPLAVDRTNVINFEKVTYWPDFVRLLLGDGLIVLLARNDLIRQEELRDHGAA
jgi:hypothetical protein